METLARAANRGSISTGFDIDNSLKFEPDNSEFLSRTIGSTSNRKTFTVSCWFKRTELKAGAADASGHMLFMSGVDAAYMVSMVFHTWQDTYADTLEFRVNGASNNNTTRRFRDTSAWYHIVLAVDTTQATETNRWKLYVNGVQETSFSQTSYPSQNADTYNNVADSKLRIGSRWYAGSESGYFAGYIADYYHIDGQALAPTDFGEFDEDSGIWKPKAYTGSFGTNGWYLDFVDGANLGDDASGNGNNFTENNITAADQATDTPTNNFCTLNPLFVGNQSTPPSDGATYMSDNGTNQDVSYAGTMGVTKGKWYYETYIDMRSSNYGLAIYVGYHTFKDNYRVNAYWSSTNQDSTALYNMHNGQFFTWNGGSRNVVSGLGSIGASGVGKYVGIALNLDDNQITFYYDGSAITNGSNLALNNLGTDTDAGIFAIPAISVYDNNHTVNFGGYTKAPISSAQSDANGYGTFEHAPPTGYYALCTKNLAEFG